MINVVQWIAGSLKTSTICACALALLTSLTACGTTSNIKTNADAGAPADRPNLSAYETVIVQDFSSTYTDKKYNDVMMVEVGKKFADLIHTEITATGAFTTVERATGDRDPTAMGDQPAEPTLIVGGVITRYDDGNAAARALIGLGAGSSYFEAMVTITDLATGDVLGRIQADKNSWVLGGGLAAGQTAGSFMPNAAKKVATELQKSKVDGLAANQAP